MASVVGTDSGETIDATWGVTDGDDQIKGAGGADTIYGLGGNDQIFGNGFSLDGVIVTDNASDTIYAGDGDDQIGIDGSNDYVDGGNGIDTLFVATNYNYNNISLRLNSGTVISNGIITDRFTNIENVQMIGSFGETRMIVYASAAANDITGSGDLTRVSYVYSPVGVTISLGSQNAGSGGYAQGDFLHDVGELEGSSYADLLGASDRGDTLYGLGGDDTLKGGGGADWLDGGAGADTLRGGAGNDTYIFDGTDVIDENYAPSSGIDTVRSAVTVSLADTAHFKGDIENLILTGTSAISGTGNALNNTITGNGAANLLNGGDGNDVLDGGAGADTMHGGLGNDSYFVDNAGDIVFEVSGNGTDTVFARASYVLTAGQSIETLRASSVASTVAMNLTGNSVAQSLYGNAGDNVLDGGGGGDRMTGYGGNDTYVINSSSDLVFEANGQGNDTVNARVSYVLAAGQSVETLKFTSASGTTDLDLTGNSLAQTLLGNAGDNRLDGGGGADRMTGYGGDDGYFVDNSGDLIFEAVGGGTDTVFARTSYALAAGQSIEVLRASSVSGTTAMDLTGNEFAQVMYGNNGANHLDGGGGADTMRGYGGDDSYYVDNGADLVFEASGGGNDTVFARASYALQSSQSVETLRASSVSSTAAMNLTGNNLAQTINGNAGNNLIDGKGGSDTLRGYGGSDTFQFSTALGSGNVDHIADFSTTFDTIRLDRTVFAALGLGTLDADAFKDIGVAGAVVDANDRILYNHNTGELFYDSNGSAAGGRVEFAILDNKPANLTHADFFVVS